MMRTNYAILIFQQVLIFRTGGFFLHREVKKGIKYTMHIVSQYLIRIIISNPV